ncbi:hypothetical protein, partial [Pseudonocardia sp.]|uniref:hypothetical protein n=1 Tax=Pseudonocardia sp. TaxID=60912 RepID=UPI0031FCD4F8
MPRESRLDPPGDDDFGLVDASSSGRRGGGPVEPNTTGNVHRTGSMYGGRRDADWDDDGEQGG